MRGRATPPPQGYIEYPPSRGGMWPLLTLLTLFLPVTVIIVLLLDC